MFDEHHKEYLKNRRLHRLLWWDERSRETKWKYYTLRTITIIGGSVIPLLVGLGVAPCNMPESQGQRCRFPDLGNLKIPFFRLGNLRCSGQICLNTSLCLRSACLAARPFTCRCCSTSASSVSICWNSSK